MARYKVKLETGEIINIPSDVRTRYESINEYGLQAVLERMKRTRAYKAAVEKSGEKKLFAKAIILPSGEEITQF